MQNQAYMESFLDLNRIPYEMTDYSFETMKEKFYNRIFIIDPENIGISFPAPYKELVVIKNKKLSSYSNWSKSEGYTEQKNLFNKIIFLSFYNKLKIGNRYICLKYQNLVLCKKTQEFYWNFKQFDCNLYYYISNYYHESYYTVNRERQDNSFIYHIETLLNENLLILFNNKQACYDINLDSILVQLKPLNIVLHIFNHESCEDFNDQTYIDTELLQFWIKLLITIQHIEIINKSQISSKIILFKHQLLYTNLFVRLRKTIRNMQWPALVSQFHTHISRHKCRRVILDNIYYEYLNELFFTPEEKPPSLWSVPPMPELKKHKTLYTF